MNENVKLALVVDDSATQCAVLSHLLSEERYQVITAKDGAEGVDMYLKHQPELVLMDINMPVMNGYEAAKKIKGYSDRYSLCPLIFVTNESTDSAYIECVEAGGDGILVKPFSPAVFKAKIKSIQRISDLYAQVKKLQQAQEADIEIAEKLMSGVIEARNYGVDKIGSIKKAAELFSGDIQLSALCPNGDVNVLLGDFTGHGLRSSIGAVPLAETFRVMTRKGFAIIDIVTQVNSQLYNLLPVDLFLAATFVTISAQEESIFILNAGLPDAYVFSAQGEIKQRIISSHPPMGVVAKLLPDTQVSVVAVERSDRVVLISDGIIEAENEYNQMYGYHQFEQAASKGIIKHNISAEVLNSVNEFCRGMVQEDDISLVDIPCQGWRKKVPLANPSLAMVSDESLSSLYFESQAVWKLQLTLTGPKLAMVNPIPMLVSQINEIEGSGEHWFSLHTVLTELFVNALDHGILGLSSDIKEQPDGFVEYFNEREARLKKIDSGVIDIQLENFPLPHGGRLKLKITDTGEGFDVEKYHLNKQQDATKTALKASGRGIELVEQLTESLEYIDNGRTVEASYLWSQ